MAMTVIGADSKRSGVAAIRMPPGWSEIRASTRGQFSDAATPSANDRGSPCADQWKDQQIKSNLDDRRVICRTGVAHLITAMGPCGGIVTPAPHSRKAIGRKGRI
jgi:hypothetical protein